MEIKSDKIHTNKTRVAAAQEELRVDQKDMAHLREECHACISQLSAADAYNDIYPYLTAAHTPIDTPTHTYPQYCPNSHLYATLKEAGQGPLHCPSAYDLSLPLGLYQGHKCPLKNHLHSTAISPMNKNNMYEGWADPADTYKGWTNDGDRD